MFARLRPTKKVQPVRPYLWPFLFGICAAGTLVILYITNRSTSLEIVDRILLEDTGAKLKILQHSLPDWPRQSAGQAIPAFESMRQTLRDPAELDVIDRQGRVVASTESQQIGRYWPDIKGFADKKNPESPEALGPVVSMDPATGHIRGYARLMSAPAAEIQSVDAFVQIRSDASARRQEARSNIWNALVFQSIVVAAFAGAFCLVFYASLNRRVAELASSLSRFKKGDWKARNCLPGKDALAGIGRSLNELLDDVVRERTDSQISEAKVKAVLETAIDGIISIDCEGRVELMNSAAERIFGYAKDRVVGQNIGMLMPESFSREHDRYIGEYLKTGRARIIGIGREVSGRRSDGTVFPLELAVSELRLGNERSFTGIIRDISARKRIEEQLRISQEQLHQTVENAPIGIVTCDLDCRILNANRACTKVVGYTRAELLNMLFTDLVCPDERQKCLEFAQKAKLNQLENTAVQQRWLHKDGYPVHGVLHIGVIHNAQGIPEMFVIQMEDFTEQRNAEAEARQLRDRIAHVGRITTLGEMAAGIAHEINQPLAAIVNYTDASQRLLIAGAANPKDLIHAMKQASAQAHRAARVLQQLRDFAKMRSVPQEKVDLNALIKDVVSLANLETPGLRSAINLELDEDLPQLKADPVQIQQVILNLIRNGVDAMQEPGTQDQDLTIRTVNETSGFVRIEVIDQGTGVDEKSADKIFDPFFSTKQSGMGLGLSICRSIARSHGGQLDFANNANRGATFFLRLPTIKN